MCRIAAYLGQPIKLEEFLLQPAHSLVQQSFAAKEMQDATVNADGFGFAWLTEAGAFCDYKNVLPIWSDTNLSSLGKALSSRLWLANVRSATLNQGISIVNTQPFIKDNIVFAHNGCIKPFAAAEKLALAELLSKQLCAEINGDTDSWYLFALLKQHYLVSASWPRAMLDTVNTLADFCGNQRSLLFNIIISDGQLIYALRHAINAPCPSLYYSQQKTGIYVASEPLDSGCKWLTFPAHQLIIFAATKRVSQQAL